MITQLPFSFKASGKTMRKDFTKSAIEKHEFIEQTQWIGERGVTGCVGERFNLLEKAFEPPES
jgi:hypothetical protein